MAEYKAERTVSAVFKQEDGISDVVRKLINRDIPRDRISVMGNNFQSQTKVTGFISKKDVILGGLRSGAIFGSLFGSFLALLSGVGVLFIPFVGPIVAAGPIGGALLGAASGALAGSAGAGLASILVTLGMPEDKAAIYETRLKAGEFIVMVEVPEDRTGEFQLLLESAGGEEVHTNEMVLPRACEGRCNNKEDLAPEIRSHLSDEAQQIFIERYNSVLDETNDDNQAEKAAWEAVQERYDEDENGVWSKVKVSA